MLSFVFNVLFTLEALLRVATYLPLRAAWRDASLWLDCVTVIPFWVRPHAHAHAPRTTPTPTHHAHAHAHTLSPHLSTRL